MTALWGPAYDAEIDYRRAGLTAASRPRARRRGARSPRGRAGGRTAARPATAQAALTGLQARGVPATASPRR